MSSDSTSVIDRFFLKLGTFLTMTKDALLEDFLQDLPSYIPGTTVSQDPIHNYDELKARIGEAELSLNAFIDYIFRRLGYDLSQFEKNQELYDLVSSIITTLDSMGETVTKLSDEGINWDNVKIESDGKDGVKMTFDGLFSVKQGDSHSLSYSKGGFSASLSFGDGALGGRLQPILDLLSDLFKLIKKFHDLEWKSIRDEYEEFGTFLDDTYFNEEFAERLFDHVLTVLLRNARKVYNDEILEIARDIDKVKELAKEAREQVEQEVFDRIAEIRRRLDEIEKQLEKELKDAKDEAVSLLKAEYELLKEELEKKMKEVLGPIGKIGDTLDKIYRILDFMGVAGTKTVHLAKYVKGYTVPTPEEGRKQLQKLNDDLAAAYQRNLENCVADANAGIREAVAAIKAEDPTVRLYVIRWSALSRLMNDPMSYLKERFPIHDYDDAVALIMQIDALVRAFNPDIPDFSSISALINDLIVRMQKEVTSAASSLSKEVKDKVRRFEQFLLDLKKVLEAYGITARKQLEKSFQDLKEGGMSTLNDLQSAIRSEVDLLQDAAKEAKKTASKKADIIFRAFNGFDADLEETLRQVFLVPLVRILKDKAKAHKVFSEVNPDEWENALRQELDKAMKGASSMNNLFGEYKDLMTEIEARVTEVFSDKYWDAGFKNLADALEKEFIKQTAKVPGSYAAWKDFGVDQVNNLLSGKSVSNPFSDFDIMAYFNLFTKQVKAYVPSDLDGYYLKFKDTTLRTLSSLLGAAEDATSEAGRQAKKAAGKAADYAAKVEYFLEDVYTSYWEELKQSVYKVVVRPYLAAVERAVKRWLREVLLPEVVKQLRKELSSLLDYNAYKELFNEVQDAASTAQRLCETAEEEARKAQEVAESMLLLANDAGGIDSWQDGLRFAIRLYRIIPPSVRDAVKDLARIPDWDFSGIRLPDYQLDMKGSFLIAPIFSYSDNFSFQLMAFAADRKTLDEDGKERTRSGVFLFPVVQAKYDSSFNLGASHKLTVGVSGSLNEEVQSRKSDNDEAGKSLENGTLGIFLSAPDGPESSSIELISSSNAVRAYLELVFGRQTDKPLYIYGYDDNGKKDDGVLHMKMDDYPQKLFVGYKDSALDAGYLGQVQGLDVALSLANVNSFFDIILNGDISGGVDKFKLGYSLQDGLTIGGSYHLRLPINGNIDLKKIKFDNFFLDLAGGSSGSLSLGIDLNFTVDFSALKITFPDMGFGFDLDFLTPDFHLGSLDFNPNFKFPDGLGLSLDIGDMVKGTGVIKWDLDAGEFLGALELSLFDRFGGSALVLLNTKMPDGSKGFSFLGALSVFFKPGIQMGLGFSLTGLGASLGLNRRIDENEIRRSVFDGSLESVLLVKNLIDNLSTVLANVTSFYPVQKDSFFFGAMLQITWTGILDITCGLFIQVPDVVVIIAGGVHLNISDTIESLVSLNADFMGAFDPHKGISFDASLYDTRFVGIDFYGDVALRIYWGGSTKGFLMSAGGFHPEYTPEAGFNVPDMKRIGYRLDFGPLKISNESYMAITSNTVQFGSDSRLQVGWKEFGISGRMYFNVLFQFNPFQFMFDCGISAALHAGSCTLMSISLSLEFRGPARWHFGGKAHFCILFVSFGVDVSETWGKKQKSGDKEYIDILRLMQNALEDEGNWAVIRCDLVDGLVSVHDPEEGSFAMSPSDTISFTQESLPLNFEMDKFGQAYPSDVTRIKILEVMVEGDQKSTFDCTTTYFAPAQVKEMSDKEKLYAPSYKEMEAGFELSAGYDSKHGTDCPVKFEADLQMQGGIDWEKWQKEAASASSTKAAPAKIALKSNLPKNLTGYKIGRAGEKSVRRGIPDDLVARPHSRRDADGFNRYLADLDVMTKRSVKGYIDKLNPKVKLEK